MTYYRMIKRITTPLTGHFQDLHVLDSGDAGFLRSEALQLVAIMNQGPKVTAQGGRISFHFIPIK